MDVKDVNVDECIQRFRKDSKPTDSNASFDYCYNYFYSYKDNPEELANEKNLHMSCLQLGFFLASWGMFRSRAPLRKKSVKCYAKLITKISQMPKELWAIDVDNYTDENIELLWMYGDKIKKVLIEAGVNNSDTLVTKIMLGVFANVPAYDKFFREFLGKKKYCKTFGKKSLHKIKEFYDQHKEKIDCHNQEIRTYRFQDSGKTDVRYTRAKIIDMCGFVAGGGYEKDDGKGSAGVYWH